MKIQSNSRDFFLEKASLSEFDLHPTDNFPKIEHKNRQISLFRAHVSKPRSYLGHKVGSTVCVIAITTYMQSFKILRKGFDTSA